MNWARFQHDLSGKEFLLYASRFISQFGPNPDSAVIRQCRHANGMVQLMGQHSFLNIPRFTAGDFNVDNAADMLHFLQHQVPITYNSSTIKNPIELDDTWYIANPGINKSGTVGEVLPSLIGS